MSAESATENVTICWNFILRYSISVKINAGVGFEVHRGSDYEGNILGDVTS
jgi:hypothetical protein